MNQQHLMILKQPDDQEAQIYAELERLHGNDRVDLYARWLHEHRLVHKQSVVRGLFWTTWMLGLSVMFMSTATTHSDRTGAWFCAIIGLGWLFGAAWSWQMRKRCNKMTDQVLARLVVMEREDPALRERASN